LVLSDLHLGLNSAKELSSILAVNLNVAKLDVSKNYLMDEGVEVLMKAIKCNEQLVHLNIGQNSLTPSGTKKVFKTLIKNQTLASLFIGNSDNTSKNKVDGKSLRKLVEYM
jgi:Ran GTPase-activating protein (RanGAP) involved in mRNA processing and transport